MSAIIARATAAVPTHLRLNDADTVNLAVPTADDSALGDRVNALLADPDVPAQYAAELRVRMRQILSEVDAAEYVADSAKVIRAAQNQLGLPVEHPAWEVACLPGDTPLHLSREYTVTVPSGLGGKTVEIGSQVQQTEGEPADIWLIDRVSQLTVDDAEAYAMTILTAVVLARRVNAAREAGTEAAA